LVTDVVAVARPAGLASRLLVPREEGVDPMNNQANQEQSAKQSQGGKAEGKTAVDPVCGMDVTTAGNAHRLEKNGHVYFFCSTDCREQFEASPEVFER
jgi:YHS domain-containing protein